MLRTITMTLAASLLASVLLPRLAGSVRAEPGGSLPEPCDECESGDWGNGKGIAMWEWSPGPASGCNGVCEISPAMECEVDPTLNYCGWYGILRVLNCTDDTGELVLKDFSHPQHYTVVGPAQWGGFEWDPGLGYYVSFPIDAQCSPEVGHLVQAKFQANGTVATYTFACAGCSVVDPE